jgi:hypothetical protein
MCHQLQFWGAAKLQFRAASHAAMIGMMEHLVIECLDAVPLSQIWW